MDLSLTQPRKIHQLEGVRGIGALIVVICHFQIVFFPQFYTLIANALKQHLPVNASNFIVYMVDLSLNGNMFLHIFWALSAYVIFKKFFERNAGNTGLISNAVKRYFRLMIPCAASIFFSYLIFRVGLIYINGVHVKTLQQNLYSFNPTFLHALKTSVWDTYFNYNFADSFNGPLWTIEKEFYGSVFCFALFGIIGLSKNRGFLYLLIFVCVLILKLYWLNSFLFGYYLSDFDFGSKNHGSVLYKTAANLNRFMVSHQFLSVAIFLFLYFVLKFIPYRVPETLDEVSSFLSFCTILIALRITVVEKVMTYPLLTKLGKVSFGLYLLHWPFMCSFTAWYYLKFNHSSYGSIAVLFLSTLSLSIALATLFYKYVDLNSIICASKIAKRVEKLTTDNVKTPTAGMPQLVKI